MKTLPEELNILQGISEDPVIYAYENRSAINALIAFLQPEESSKFKDVSSTNSQRHRMMQDSNFLGKGDVTKSPAYSKPSCCPKCNFKKIEHETNSLADSLVYFSGEYCGKPDCECHKPSDFLSKLKSRIEGMRKCRVIIDVGSGNDGWRSQAFLLDANNKGYNQAVDDFLALLEEPMEEEEKSKGTWKGKEVTEMSKEELIKALEDSNELYLACLKNQ